MNNKVAFVLIGVWLSVLTYLQFSTEPVVISDKDSAAIAFEPVVISDKDSAAIAYEPVVISDKGSAVIAYVHGDTIQQGMLLIQSLEATLREKMTEVESVLQAQALPLQEEAQELISYANSGQASSEEIDIASRRVGEIESTLERMQYEAEQSFALREKAMQDTISKHLTGTLRTFSKDRGIDLVLNWGLSGEGVLYGTDSRDITTEVLEALNVPK